MKTYAVKASEIERSWWVVDATDQTLGRLATRIATLLEGKHKPIYSPHLDTGDHVVVLNAGKIRVTGDKLRQKSYFRHSGYPGGLREESLGHLLERKPELVIERAVKGMLPAESPGPGDVQEAEGLRRRRTSAPGAAPRDDRAVTRKDER